MTSISVSTDEEWQNFLMGVESAPEIEKIHKIENKPICDDLYISTKTKVLYLNQEIDIQRDNNWCNSDFLAGLKKN